MEILVALGDIYGAEKLVPITSAQISGVSYKTIGDAGLEFIEELSKDANVRVPSTLNPAGVDLANMERTWDFQKNLQKNS
jgi:predicted aconitase